MIWDVILPRSRAFSLTINKTLRSFFSGLNFNDDFRDDADSILTNIDPALTNNLEKWEEQFYLRGNNLTEAERRTRLDASWKMTGGQSPAYLQSVLRSFGYDVYLYNWWNEDAQVSRLTMGGSVAFMGGDKSFMGATFGVYPTAYDPSDILTGDSYILLNELSSTRDSEVPITTNANYWRHFIYIAGADINTPAIVDESSQDDFEELILSIFPASKYIGMVVRYNDPVSLAKSNEEYDELSSNYTSTIQNLVSE